MHNRSIYFPHFNRDQRSEAANRHVTDLSLMHLRDTDNWLSNTTHPIGANIGPTNTWSRTSADPITSQVGGQYRHLVGILSLEWTLRCLGLGVQNRILEVWRTPLILNFGVHRRFQDVIYAVRRLNGSPEIMIDSAYFVKSTPLTAFTGSFQYFADILKMCMKMCDAEKMFFDKLTGLLT